MDSIDLEIERFLAEARAAKERARAEKEQARTKAKASRPPPSRGEARAASGKTPEMHLPGIAKATRRIVLAVEHHCPICDERSLVTAGEFLQFERVDGTRFLRRHKAVCSAFLSRPLDVEELDPIERICPTCAAIASVESEVHRPIQFDFFTQEHIA